MADALEKMIDQIKKLQEKIKALEAAGGENEALKERLAVMESKLTKNPDFGDW
jgi:uncharacterized protein YigA (DUF484 family)